VTAGALAAACGAVANAAGSVLGDSLSDLAQGKRADPCKYVLNAVIASGLGSFFPSGKASGGAQGFLGTVLGYGAQGEGACNAK
jgi:hypothetical protein